MIAIRESVPYSASKAELRSATNRRGLDKEMPITVTALFPRRRGRRDIIAAQAPETITKGVAEVKLEEGGPPVELDKFTTVGDSRCRRTGTLLRVSRSPRQR